MLKNSAISKIPKSGMGELWFLRAVFDGLSKLVRHRLNRPELLNDDVFVVADEPTGKGTDAGFSHHPKATSRVFRGTGQGEQVLRVVLMWPAAAFLSSCP